MSWIKEQVEARRKAEEEHLAEQKRQAEAQIEHRKKMTVAAPKAFSRLAERIIGDVEELNNHSAKKFNVRYGAGSPLLEVHRRGELAPLLAIALDARAEKISYKHIRIGYKGIVSGSIQILLRPNGESGLAFEGTAATYEEASQRLLSPIF